MSKTVLLVCLVFVVGVSGCTSVQKGAGIGAAAGAGLGAIIGHQSGNAGEGALLGAAGGALAGALVADAQEQQDPVIKFCSECGKRFKDTDMIYCPYDGAELQILEE